MEHSNLIALAVPGFLAMIFIEVWLDRKAKAGGYDLGDSVASLGCGVLSQVVAVVFAAALAAFYGGMYLALGRLAPLRLGGAAAWIVGVLAVDFMYYWWHRWSHQINFLWAMHVVHHQSDRYNLTTALRQSAFGIFVGWSVYVPIALLGVPFPITVAAQALDTIYQFWIHTERIKTLGPVELVMNTPSHHRVHHGTNARYIDKNYAGIFISWDKLFGSFEPESEKVEYGITTGFPSRSAAWANLHYWAELAELSRRAGTLKDKLLVWVMFPGWRPEGVAKLAPETRASEPSPSAKRAALALLAGGIAVLIAMYRVTGPWARLAARGAVVAGLILCADWILRDPVEAQVNKLGSDPIYEN